MSVPALVFYKLKQFRMTLPSLILLVFASYRTFTSGHAIQLVGICASVVPFICQFKNFPKAPRPVSALKEVLSNYILNLVLMLLYLGWVLLLTFAGQRLWPGYQPNPHFWPMMLLAVCADVVFISALIPVCHDLQPMQRMMPGILLCNAQLVFMMLAADYVKKAAPQKLMIYCAAFIGAILVLTVNFMVIAYTDRRKKG